MFNLPEKTIVNKKIPKSKFYENLNISTKEKRLFIDEIESVVWLAKITPETVAVTGSAEIEEIEVIALNLYQDTCSEAVLKLINKAIPYHLVFVLRFGEKEKYAVYHGKYFYSEWLKPENDLLSLQGFTLEDIWSGFVIQIGGIHLETDRTLDEQIAENERKEKILSQIEKLERMAAKEKQPNKKFELHQEILKLKNNL